jgi:hypothetical protein
LDGDLLWLFDGDLDGDLLGDFDGLFGGLWKGDFYGDLLGLFGGFLTGYYDGLFDEEFGRRFGWRLAGALQRGFGPRLGTCIGQESNDHHQRQWMNSQSKNSLLRMVEEESSQNLVIQLPVINHFGHTIQTK